MDFKIQMFILQTTLPYVLAYDPCEEFGICEDVDNYPTELVRGLIKELKSKNTIFNNDAIDMFVANRFDVEKEELCDFTQLHMIPRKAKDSKGILRIILNDLNDPVQGFNIATCNKRNSKCTDLLGFSATHKGVCIQKFTLREMYYLDDNNQTARTHFKIPICCSCMLNPIN
ncbi:neurotrophin 1-like isoform X2 [Pararge aegeria]|uniref:Jg16229 protein n=1 Tax=Pararge aegeria aegeria TaxID=348720 RepID=A0A8S4RXE6_9NEOP|nr:neurotrophin 1-like isoform X2 [Pararge aegeria]CAH2241839.1 jg16229 [Pararge aegeria aegeria]